jgi:glycosyltransferase involved in cell wall biosynthesis
MRKLLHPASPCSASYVMWSGKRLDALVLLQNLAGGGAERVLLGLAAGLARSAMSVQLLLLRAEGAYLDQVPSQLEWSVLGRARTRQVLPALVRRLRRQRPRWLVTGLTHVNLVGIAARLLALCGTRALITEHNRIEARGQVPGGAWARRLMPLLYPLADEIVAVSRGVGADVVRTARVSPDRVRVIHNPIVSQRIAALAGQGPPHPWAAGDGPPLIIGIGRLVPQKGFATLMRAFSLVRAHRPARLVILGEGPKRDCLMSLAQKLGIESDVLLPGFVTNPFAWLGRASLFVLSSAWEGLPTVLVEALACGTPVVATDCPHGPRDILENGDLGPLVPVGDSEKMADAMRRVLDAPTERSRLLERAAAFHEDRAIETYRQILAAGT